MVDRSDSSTVAAVAHQCNVPWESIIFKCRHEGVLGIYGPGSTLTQNQVHLILTWATSKNSLVPDNEHEKLTCRMQRWLLAQKISIAAFELLETSTHRSPTLPLHDIASAPDEGRFGRVQSHTVMLLQAYACNTGWARSLPPSTINLLYRAVLKLPRTFRVDIREAHSELITGSEGGTTGERPDREHGSPISLATIVASVILYGAGDARRMVRLAHSLFKTLKTPQQWGSKGTVGGSVSWKTFGDTMPDKASSLAEALGDIRSAAASGYQRLIAVSRLCEIIKNTAWCEQIENALYHQCFAWPLLVSTNGDTAIALPLLVSADLPTQLESAMAHRNRVEVIGHYPVLDISSGARPTFVDWLWLARDAARDLWRRQHGSTGDFRHYVEEFTARFDFRFASAVIQDATHDIGPKRVALTGGSASAYLSQVLLSRLLGRRSVMNSIITGQIGRKVCDSRTEDELLDYGFEGVGSIANKLRYVFDSEFSDEVVVPSANAGDVATMLGSCEPVSPQTAEVISGCVRLSNVADVVHSAGWRRTQYIRCPEVGYATVGWKSAWVNDAAFQVSSSVETVVSALSSSEDAVLAIDERIWPITVSQALEYINSAVREYQYDSQGRLFKLDAPPASLSWTFIRMVDGEEDAEFWQIVWHAIGSSIEDFDRFSSSPTTAIAAEHLIKALNQYSPTQANRSHRAPDLLVLIGYDRYRQKFSQWTTPSSRPLAPAAIINEVHRQQRSLGVAPHRSDMHERGRHVWNILKRTRILLVGEPNQIASQGDGTPRLDRYDKDTLSQLRSLAVFDHGFCSRSAAMVLKECGIRGNSVKVVLESLKEQGYVLEFGGEYFLPVRLRSDVLTMSEDRAVGAMRHLMAARSLAPYAVRGAMPGLSLDRALLPKYVIEAQQQFGRARSAAIRAIADTLATAHRSPTRSGIMDELATWKRFTEEVKGERQTMERAALWAGRGLVYHLINRGTSAAGADADVLINELIDAWQSHRLPNGCHVPAHPQMRLAAARAYAATQPSQMNLTYRAWHGQVVDRFEQALHACDSFPGTLMSPNERRWYRINIKCWFSDFLDGTARQSAGHPGRSITLLDREIWRENRFWLSCAGEGAVIAQWLERQADNQQSVQFAAETYLLGHELFNDWHQFRFKALGAASVAGIKPRTLCDWLNQCYDPFYDVAELALRCRGAKDRARKDIRLNGHNERWDRVRCYWEQAVLVLQDQWGPVVRGFNEALLAALENQGLQDGQWIEIPGGNRIDVR